MSRRRLANRIFGVARQRRTITVAKRKGCITAGTVDWRAAVAMADLVILACPVHAILAYLRRIGPFLPDGCIVMDVGSTKSEIVRTAAAHLPARVSFVGTHPLAGSEKTGPAEARPDLFSGCVCFVTPGKKSDPEALARISSLWRKLGARVVVTSPPVHDGIVAYTSHLPHLLAAVLMRTVSPDVLPYTASGFRDMTRIAAGDEGLWQGIFSTNRSAVRSAIDSFQAELGRFQRLLTDTRTSPCKKFLAAARRRRESLPGGSP
jgi:prephenate dehydrogenase